MRGTHMARDAKIFLAVLTGLPAAGKSTFARALALEMDRAHGINVMIAASDNVRAELPVLGERFMPEIENTVRRLSLARVRDALREGLAVVFDDLNYYRSMRRQAYAIARDLRVPYFLVHLATPETDCLRLNAARGKPIPDDVITTDAVRFDPPGGVPWDEPYLTLTAGSATAGAFVPEAAQAANDMLRRAAECVPPLDESATGTVERTRVEELDLLSRRVVGELYMKHGKARDAKALRLKRLELLEKAAGDGLDDGAAEALFAGELSALFS